MWLRVLLLASVFWISLIDSWAQVGNSADLGLSVWSSRKSALKKQIPDGNCAVVFSGTLQASGFQSNLPGPFFCDPNFFYLTGLEIPHAVLVIFPKPIELKEGASSEVLFVPDAKQYPISAMGYSYAGTFGQVSEGRVVRPISQWKRFCVEILDSDRFEKVWILPTSPADFNIYSQNFDFHPPVKTLFAEMAPRFQAEPDLIPLYHRIMEVEFDGVSKLQGDIRAWLDYFGQAPDPILRAFTDVVEEEGLEKVKDRIGQVKFDFLELSRAMGNLRMQKSDVEVKHLEASAKVAIEAWKAGGAKVQAGMNALQVEAVMSAQTLVEGAKLAQSIQVISGSRSDLLLYEQNDWVMEVEDWVVVDLAVQKAGYCAHVSRTMPVVGNVSGAWAEAFKVAVASHSRLIAGCKAGVQPSQLMSEVKNSLVERLEAKVLVSGKRRSWRDDFGVVSISPIGLQLYEFDNPAVLEAGMVFEVETSLVVPKARKFHADYQGMLIRLRDVVVVKPETGVSLTGALPLSWSDLSDFLSN